MAPVKTPQVRIIGGLWRGRRLSFPDHKELRPSPDRVRETLFNWLSPHMDQSRGLDLFAGSGALGFEALSRGAQAVTFVEKDQKTHEALVHNAHALKASNAHIICGEALSFLAALPPRAFDVIFLDPPFASELLAAALTIISTRGILAPTGLIYMEAADVPPLPKGWRWHRQSRAGKVVFGLATPHEE